MGFPSAGAEVVARRLDGRRPRGLVVGVSIGPNAFTPPERRLDDYLSLVESFAEVADYLAVNVSSPNTAGLRQLQGETLESVLAAIVAAWFLLAQNILREVVGITLCVVVTLTIALVIAQKVTNKVTFKDLFNSLRSFWPMWVGPVVLAGISLIILGWFGWKDFRGTPWAYFYFWNVVAWGLMLWGLACIFYPDQIGIYCVKAIGDWIRFGGCVMIFNKDKRNLPANSFAAVWVVILFITLLYGLPLPWIIDSEQWLYETATATGLVKPDSLPERYVRSWFWIEVTIVLFPVVVAGLAFGAFEGAGLGSRIHGMHFRPGRPRRDELFAWWE